MRVQLCGDAYLSNLGLFAAPDRRMVFDLNDFDEPLHGPWEWDVKRLAASFAVADREIGYPAKQRSEIVRETVRGHREAMRGRTHVVPTAGRRRMCDSLRRRETASTEAGRGGRRRDAGSRRP